MFCTRHRSLIVVVAFVLLSAVLSGPGTAHARPLGGESPARAARSIGWVGFLGEWLRELFEKAGWGMDPNGSGTAAPADSTTGEADAGWGMDPNGVL